MLVDQGDNRCVWAEPTPRRSTAWPSCTRTALRHLAVALNVHLSVPRQQNARELATPMGPQIRALDAAQALMGEWRSDYEARAERILRDLIASTPTFPPWC